MTASYDFSLEVCVAVKETEPTVEEVVEEAAVITPGRHPNYEANKEWWEQ